MSIKASYQHRVFHFKRPSGTSRGVLTEKHSWILKTWDAGNPRVVGIGECSVIPGLSPDFSDIESYEMKLDEVCSDLNTNLDDYPSIKFGVESALLDLKNGGNQIYFDNDFTKGLRKLPINGLIWMGEPNFIRQQVTEKIAEGFTTIKMKIAALDIDVELNILREIRSQFDANNITLRVDANGGIPASNALTILHELAKLDIHSIEQPIEKGQLEEMKKLCAISPVPIALDEELIGISETAQKKNLLETIKPQYIILKPSLHGGISGIQEWIELAESMNISWWMTSALESNIGLNVICQLTGEYDNDLPQGLGTGSLYTDNIPSALHVESGYIQLKKG